MQIPKVHWKHPLMGFAIAILLAIQTNLAGAQNNNGNADPGPEGDVHPRANTMDHKLAQVAHELPGFGGMYFDDNGDLNVYLTVKAAAEHRKAPGIWNEKAKAALIKVFGKNLLTRGVSAHRPKTGRSEARIEVREGKYDIRELMRWRPGVEHALNIKGVVLTDLNEASNRLKIGIEEEAIRADVELELRKQGVPLEAVIIEVMEPIAPLITLRDYVRPTQGGIQIQRDSGGTCTLGFNAYRRYNTNYGFVTNSHCTNVQGGTEGTRFYQNNRFNASHLIGTEAVDPTYFTSFWPWECPPGRRCRYSDAAWARYASGVSTAYRRIARPESWNSGSITISTTRPYMTIVGETATPASGEYLDKVGRTTGWTYGRVTDTCFTTNQSGSDVTMKCQYRVSRTYGTHNMIGGGDSGSPAFKWFGDTVNLYGIAWGGGSTSFVFSSMKYIEQELGSLYTYSTAPSPPSPPSPGQCPVGQKCCEPSPTGGCLLCVPSGAFCP